MNLAEVLTTMGQEPPDRTMKLRKGTRKEGSQAAVESLPEGPETCPEAPRASPERKNPFEEGRQRIFVDQVISAYPLLWAVLPDPAPCTRSVGANGTPWKTPAASIQSRNRGGRETACGGPEEQRQRKSPSRDCPQATARRVCDDPPAAACGQPEPNALLSSQGFEECGTSDASRRRGFHE